MSKQPVVMEGMSRVLPPTPRSGIDPAIDRQMADITGSVGQAVASMAAAPAACNAHASEDECLGALIILALAQHGLVIVDAPDAARLLLAQVEANAGRGARA